MSSIITVLFFSVITLFSTIYADSAVEPFDTGISTEVVDRQRKKIVIFTLNGGYGHQAASKALDTLFNKDYEVKIIDLFRTVKAGGWVKGEEWYDYGLRGGWTRTVNFVVKHIAPPLMSWNVKYDYKKVCKVLEQEVPDIVISVAPFKVAPVLQATNDLEIPLLVVTTDGDLTNWAVGLYQGPYDNVTFTIGFDNPKTRDLLINAGIREENVSLTGFPIRQDFFEKKNKALLKKEWGIPTNKFTAMLSMGGVGGQATYRYAKKMASMNLPIHLVICTGKNEKMFKKIKKLQKKSKISMTIVPFTQRISDLMAASDLLITKAGPGTINEALYMNLPMLVDKTSKQLRWEVENIKFVEKNGFGRSVTSLKKLGQEIKRFAFNKKYYDAYKGNLEQYAKQDFDNNIKKLVQELCPLPA